MRITIEVPSVEACEVTQCAYNTDRACHAQAITVGDGEHPSCDTFFPSATHAQNTSQTAGVGACKVTACQYNDDLGCAARSIHVSPHQGHADCATFSPT